jgi:MoaA/NifB/PqqE/SkfB family radical SAM enzyme
MGKIISDLIILNTYVVHLHGHGETTIVKGWEDYALNLVNNGIGTSLISNLNKQYDDNEILALSRLLHLAVSIDTLDPLLFSKLRRGGDLQHIIRNLMRIIATSKHHNPKLHLSFCMVVCDLTVYGLEQLVEFGLDIGVTGFTFCNLGVHETPAGALAVNHVSEMPSEDCIKALEIFLRIKNLCAKRNAVYDIKHGIIDSLKHKISTGSARYSLM